jgi:NTE family protein
MEAPLAASIRATCAIPGIFAPVKIENRILCDGYVCDNVPVHIAHMLGAEYVIAVDLTNEGKLEDIHNIFDVIMRAQGLQNREISSFQLAGADLVITPELSGVPATGFSRTPYIIQKGYEAAISTLQRIN